MAQISVIHSDEHRLLCAITAAFVAGHANRDHLRMLCSRVNPSTFVDAVRREGLAALAVKVLNHHDLLDSLPPSCVKPLTDLSRIQLMTNLKQTSMLVSFCEAADEAGIKVMPFKGPSLTHRLYDDVGLRSSIDLDIYVQKGDIPALKNLLLSQGYKSHISFRDDHHEQEYIDQRLAYAFIHPASNAVVELHWALLPVHNGSTIPPELVWEYETSVVLAGRSSPAISFTLLLPYLCAHASKHCWIKLKWLLDIALLIKKLSEEEMAEALWLAKEIRCERMLHIGIILADEFFDVSPPIRVNRNASATRLASEVIERWLFNPEAEHEDTARGFWFHVREREHWSDRWPFIAHNLGLLFMPSERDRELIDLPSSASFLYPLIRPVRVVKDKLSAGA